MDSRPGWTLDDLPIPEDVRPGIGWTGQMLEMADHIGAYATLLIIERFGGQIIYAPIKPTPKYIEVLGQEKAEQFCRIYAKNRIDVPVARAALDRARRAPIIALARNGDITIGEAARRARTSRHVIKRLVNHSDEGEGVSTAALPRRPNDPRQIEMFDMED